MGKQQAMRRSAPATQRNADVDVQSTVKQSKRAERFVALAIPRTKKAISDIRRLSTLGSHNYEYRREQAEKIVATLRKELDMLEGHLFSALSDHRETVHFDL